MNSIMLENLFYLGTFPFIAAMVHYFFNHCLGCRIQKKGHILLIYSLYCLLSGGLYLSPSLGIVTPFLNLILLLLLSSFYRRRLLWRIGAVIFIIAILFLSDVMVQSFLMVLFTDYPTEIYIISLFLSKFVMLIFTHVAVRLFTAYGEGSLSGWYWSFLLFCPIMSFVGIYGLHHNSFIRELNLPWLYTTLSIGLLFINFFVFLLCDRVLRLQTIQRKTAVLEQQMNYYKHQYLLAESNQKETLRFRHDMKNIFIGLQAKLKKGQLSGSQQILGTLIDDFSSSKGIAHSGNLIIDSIINYKHQVADSLNIAFQVDLRLPGDIILDSTAISVMLGNALDNAIEACERIQNTNRYIKIKADYQNGSLFIHIENPYTGFIRTNMAGNICSTKPDSRSHGLGLKSIRDMVEKYNGLLNLTYENRIFQIEIVLFNIKRAI